MKAMIAKEALLAYPDFAEEFVIHTDASHTQLSAVISKQGKPIAFYSRKLKPEQTRYTTMERELQSIVETLIKEFRNILLCVGALYSKSTGQNSVTLRENPM
jgi:RNase H-like domain found in reverse transcriptase